jgi:hypothetical protein
MAASFRRTWGTFLLVVVAAGAAVVGAQSGGAISLGTKVVAPGLMVMAIIYDARRRPRSHLMFPTVFANRSIKQASKMSPSVRIATRAS